MEFIIIDMQDKDQLQVLTTPSGKTAYFPTKDLAKSFLSFAKEPVIINLVDKKGNTKQDQIQLIKDEIARTEESWDTIKESQKTQEKANLFNGIKIGLVTAIEIISGEKLDTF